MPLTRGLTWVVSSQRPQCTRRRFGCRQRRSLPVPPREHARRPGARRAEAAQQLARCRPGGAGGAAQGHRARCRPGRPRSVQGPTLVRRLDGATRQRPAREGAAARLRAGAESDSRARAPQGLALPRRRAVRESPKPGPGAAPPKPAEQSPASGNTTAISRARHSRPGTKPRHCGTSGPCVGETPQFVPTRHSGIRRSHSPRRGTVPLQGKATLTLPRRFATWVPQ